MNLIYLQLNMGSFFFTIGHVEIVLVYKHDELHTKAGKKSQRGESFDDELQNLKSKMQTTKGRQSKVQGQS